MLDDIIIKMVEEPKLKNPVLIEGLPGVGNVGKLAAEHLIEQLEAKKFADIYSRYFPPQVLVNDNGTIKLVNNELFYLINDQILKAKPIKILGKDFRFLTFKNALFNFGIINDKIKYSDHEKTILDLIYLWQYNHMNDSRILIETSKLIKGISEEKILEYSQFYPESNRKLLKKALNKLEITQ